MFWHIIVFKKLLLSFTPSATKISFRKYINLQFLITLICKYNLLAYLKFGLQFGMGQIFIQQPN